MKTVTDWGFEVDSRRQSASAILFGLLLLAVCGCDKDSARQRTIEQLKTRWGMLEGAQNADDPVVRSEIATILAEGGAPKQLMTPLPPPAENVAVGLAEMLNSGRQDSLRKRVDELIPNGSFEFHPIQMRKVDRLVTDEEEILTAIGAALQRKECNFGIDYAWGFSANSDVLDLLELCVKLKALEAASLLDKNRPAEAVVPLASMFRISSLVAAEPHPLFRFHSVNLRELAFRVLDKISSHPETTRDVLIALHAQVSAQLNSWPHDKTAWFGDRALALHGYEMIRDGYVGDLLTIEEAEQFAREGILKDLPTALKQSVNSDERYYLLAMRKVLDSCQKPYYQRKELFSQIRQELQTKRTESDFPFAAARLFLLDLEEGHRRQAVDRRLAETWALALAAAAGEKPPDYRLDPVTGKPYDLQLQQTRVSVRVASALDSEIVVPHPKPTALSARPRQGQ